MTTIAIPSTIERAGAQLTEIDSIVTAKGWQRAAIVAAFVRLDDEGGDRRSAAATTRRSASGRLSPARFAALGFNGLKSDATVRLYVQAWLDTHDGQYPEPGKTVVLPSEPFPPTRTGTDGYDSAEGAAKTVARIIDKHGAAVVVAGLPPSKQTDVVNAIAAERGNLPRDGGTHDPSQPDDIYPGQSEDEARMDTERNMAALHHHVTMIEMRAKTHPVVISRFADELHELAEHVEMTSNLARGLTDADVDALLGGAQ